MAYTHSKYEVLMDAASGPIYSATASGDKANWSPGFMPHIVRAVAVIPTVSGTTLSGMVFNFNHLDLTSGSTASALAVINGTATVIPGRVMYKTVSGEVAVNPGEDVIFNVGTAKTAVNIRAVLYVEPKWDSPGNQSNLVAST